MEREKDRDRDRDRDKEKKQKQVRRPPPLVLPPALEPPIQPAVTTCPTYAWPPVDVLKLRHIWANSGFSRVLHFCNFLLDLWIIRGHTWP